MCLHNIKRVNLRTKRRFYKVLELDKGQLYTPFFSLLVKLNEFIEAKGRDSTDPTVIQGNAIHLCRTMDDATNVLNHLRNTFPHLGPFKIYEAHVEGKDVIAFGVDDRGNGGVCVKGVVYKELKGVPV